ncbi:MAG: sel1 repeat family protein [Muribaculaceae bacterium]|nr:sel1 repeat family protein [Muribaculaceae bacterium]
MSKKFLLLFCLLMFITTAKAQNGVILGDETQFKKYNSQNLYDNSFTSGEFELNEIEKTIVQLNYDACKRAASNKTGEAYYDLGLCHYKGIGTKVNQKSAYQNFLKSAQKDYPKGMIALAECLCKGIGCKQDYNDGIRWVLRAADKNDANAMYLAGKYLQSKGRNSDANDYFLKSSDMGNEGAMMERCKLLNPKDALFLLVNRHKEGNSIERILKDVAIGLGNSPDNAYGMALRLCGDYYFKSKDYEKGYKAYKIAASNGDEPAMFALFLASASGLGTTKDNDAAIVYLNKCKGSEAQKFINLMNRSKGMTLPQAICSKDPRELADYDWRGCILPLLTEKTPKAYYFLGYYLEKGIGLAQDLS